MSIEPTAALTIGRVSPDDRPDWERLFRGYATFYAVPMTQDILDTTFEWLISDAAPLTGFVAENGDGLIGLAHGRPYLRSLSGGLAGFLDDLYVEPGHRRGGVGRALIQAMADHGAGEGWAFLRWMTAQDNETARKLYGQIAEPTHWMTYQMSPCSTQGSD